MKYLHKYQTIFEANKKMALINEATRVADVEKLLNLTKESQAMGDILALDTDPIHGFGSTPTLGIRKPSDAYSVEILTGKSAYTGKIGITFGRNMGGSMFIVENEDGTYTFSAKEQTDPEKPSYFMSFNDEDKKEIGVFNVLKTYPTLEECLRNVWAYMVARKTPRYLDKKITYKALMNKTEYWGAKKSLAELLELEGTVAEEVSKTINFLKVMFETLGLKVEPIMGWWATTGITKGTVVVGEEGSAAHTTKPEVIGCKINTSIRPGQNTVLNCIAAQTITLSKDINIKLGKRRKDSLGEKEKEGVVNTKGIAIEIPARNDEEALPIFLAAIIKIFEYVTANSKKLKYVTKLVSDYTKEIGKNLNEIVPNIEGAWSIKKNDPRIFKAILNAIKRSQDAPTILKDISVKNPAIFTELEKVQTKKDELKLMMKFAKGGKLPSNPKPKPIPTRPVQDTEETEISEDPETPNEGTPQPNAEHDF